MHNPDNQYYYYKLATLVPVSNLQEESRALRHEHESDECSQCRKETHQDKQSPAVHLKMCTDGKTPTCKNHPVKNTLIFPQTLFSGML